MQLSSSMNQSVHVYYAGMEMDIKFAFNELNINHWIIRYLF